eukprot:scaffold8708_cov139-Skeletonema_menzelii.AAC.5
MVVHRGVFGGVGASESTDCLFVVRLLERPTWREERVIPTFIASYTECTFLRVAITQKPHGL